MINRKTNNSPTSQESEATHSRRFAEMDALYRYWESLPDGKPREAVYPLALGVRLINHISLGAFVEGCTDFRYDLIGSELKVVAPRLQPGNRSSDSLRIQQTQFDLVHDIFLTIGRTLEPQVLRVFYASMEGVSRGIYGLFLPLGRQELEDGTVCAQDMMIGLWRFEPREPVAKDRFDDLKADFDAYRAVQKDSAT